ncbi:MAG: hypothetical protein ACI89J_004011 [Hyphomicrobiaceae bacterium]|jgi:hypothetical protein
MSPLASATAKLLRISDMRPATIVTKVLNLLLLEGAKPNLGTHFRCGATRQST